MPPTNTAVPFARALTGLALLVSLTAAGAASADHWDSANDPTNFANGLEYRYEALPQTGAAQEIPWAGTYWPVYDDESGPAPALRTQVIEVLNRYDDGCNGGWDPEIYGEELGPAALYWSDYLGNRRARDTIDADGDGVIDEQEDDELDTWWGTCHAWVPAAVLEQEPQRSVEYGGVVFDPDELRVLASQLYNRTDTDFLGGRCNTDDDDVEFDEYGRPNDRACRDTNPGALHVVLAGGVGGGNGTVAVVTGGGPALWSEIVLGWRVRLAQERSHDEAMERMGAPNGWYGETFDSPDAEAWIEVEVDVDLFSPVARVPVPDPGDDEIELPVFEPHRTVTWAYLLELDRGGVIVGGEWLDSDRADHPDFLWLPRADVPTNPHLDHATIRELLARASDDGDADGDGVPDDQDRCPDEDASGVDADGDGCPDRVFELADVVYGLALHRGTERSLVASAEAAAASVARGNVDAARGQLGAFANKVAAQRGHKIEIADADLLAAFAAHAAAMLDEDDDGDEN